jgi:hypothetical protein
VSVAAGTRTRTGAANQAHVGHLAARRFGLVAALLYNAGQQAADGLRQWILRKIPKRLAQLESADDISSDFFKI